MKTYQDLFVLRDGKVTQWRLKNGQLTICEKDGFREVPYDDSYWPNWLERMRFHPREDRTDAIFLSDLPNAFENLPEWATNLDADSAWVREDLELIGDEEDFKGRAINLLGDKEEKCLCRGTDGSKTLGLYLNSSMRFSLDVGIVDDLAKAQDETDGVESPKESPRKKELLEVCDELLAVAEEKAVEYGEQVGVRLNALKKAIGDFVFRINLVGPFSCGKSSLINRWLELPHLLPTGIAPETAISTELRYGEKDRMILYPLRKGDKIVTLEGVSSANMALVRDRANHKELLNVVVYLKHRLLKAYSDLCLVDLPGLNSANPAHEAALERFIEDQETGIFCVPMSDGTAQGDVLEFLKKMELFHSRFNLLLTKADEKPASEHPAIMESTGRAIRQTLGLGTDDFVVGKVSSNSVDWFSMMLDEFQKRKDEYLTGRFGGEIRNVADEMIGPLCKALAIDYHNAKLDDAIGKLEATEKELPQVMDEILSDVRQEVAPATDRILKKVKGAVMSQKGVYLAMVKRGEDCSETVGSLVKSTIGFEARNEMGDVVQRANAKVEDALGGALDFNLGSADVSTSVDGVEAPAPEQGSKIAALVGGAGAGGAAFLLGNFFLPGIGGIVAGIIGGLIGGLLGGPKHSEDVESRIEAEFTMKLDSACNGTRPQIENLLTQAVDAYGSNLKTAITGKIKSLKDQAEQIKAEVASDRNEWDKRQKARRDAADRIKKTLERIEVSCV